jgi:hypothetical protein
MAKIKDGLLILIIIMFSACSSVKKEKFVLNRDIINKEKLAFELCNMYGSDQGIRNKKFKKKD